MARKLRKSRPGVSPHFFYNTACIVPDIESEERPLESPATITTTPISEGGWPWRTAPSGSTSMTTCTGRWLSRDPIGEVGGPNLYAMVANNPLSRIDSGGLQGFGDLIPPVPPNLIPPPQPPSAPSCKIEVCCRSVATLRSAHCVIRFTHPDGSITGCRGGPTGTGSGSSSSGSSSGGGNRQSSHCKGCCGSWGNIVAGCGTGAQNSPDPLQRGLWEDLAAASANPSSCHVIAEGPDACSVESCIASQMKQITDQCYIYQVFGPNSNTTWYQSLKACTGYSYDPPGLQPGRTDDFSTAKTCLK